MTILKLVGYCLVCTKQHGAHDFRDKRPVRQLVCRRQRGLLQVVAINISGAMVIIDWIFIAFFTLDQNEVSSASSLQVWKHSGPNPGQERFPQWRPHRVLLSVSV